MSTMSAPTRSEFLRSRFYRCALAFNKRNEQRLKYIQELLDKVDQGRKPRPRPSNKKRSPSAVHIPGCNDNGKNRNTQEGTAILSADKDKTDWVYDETKNEYVLTIGGFEVMKIPWDMFQRLKPFQRDAVKWIAGIGPIGGLLADDMGMGKTFMSLAALGARMKVGRVRMALVVAPVSVLEGWTKEGKRFLPKFSKNVRIVKVHKGTQKERQKIVRNAWKDASPGSPFLIVSSWGLVASARTMGAFLPPVGRHWDNLILDEAHEIKNHASNRSKCCRRLCHKSGTSRLLLTGTPFQNDTTELWSIMTMATGSRVLGKIKEFNREYGKPIRDARCRNASSYALKRGEEANARLQEQLKPYLLRRCKIDFLSHELPPKIETCVWVKPSNQQRRMYKEKVEANGYLARDMFSSDATVAKEAKLGAFQVIAALKKLCGHPLRLLKGGPEVDIRSALEYTDLTEKILHGPEADIRSALEQTDLTTILHGSKKLELIVHMLKGFKAEDHKTLIFSQSTQNLDIIQHVLRKLGKFTVCRIDGSVREKHRVDTIECFQKGMFDVLLLSTGAGGVGVTLTRASRVILYDPSWNPSEDAQAVDRAYRIGQSKEVRVYRLFLAGGIEEKIYERQLHKTGLEKTIFTKGNKPETRYFDKHELCKIFSIIPDGSCDLLKRFEQEGVAQVVDAHRHDLVRAHSSVVGISNHGNVYRQKRKNAFADAPDIVSKKMRAEMEETASADAPKEVEDSQLAVVSESETSATRTASD